MTNGSRVSLHARRVAGWLLACLFAGTAAAQEATDAGLVNQSTGAVAYAAKDGVSHPVQAFMKVQEGDRFTVPAGASVRLVYFQGNRQETWRGPAAFRVTKSQGEAASGKPEVNVLPSAVPAKMARLPQLMQNVKLGGLGGVVIRGGRAPAPLTPEEQAQLTQARGNYAVLRAQSSADDITPELYLISTLQEFGQYQEMGPLLDEVSKHQPLAPEVEDLVRWLRARAGS